MSETSPGPPEDRPTEPFVRGKITWGRPPQAVFRVGPLPRSEAPQGERPALRSAGGIMTGSMVPSARAAAPVAEPRPEVTVEPVVAPEPEPITAGSVVASVAPVAEPEPVIADFEPVEPVHAAPELAPAPQEIVIEPEAPEPSVTVPPPLSSETKPAAKPRSLPSVVVTPAIYATMGAAMQKVAKTDRWLVVAGIAAVVVTGGFIWLVTQSAPQPVAPAPTPLVAAQTPLVDEPAPVETPATPSRVAPVPESTAPAATTAAPSPRPTARSGSPATVAPSVPAPSVEAAPRPYIETAPLVVEPPTAAVPPSRDPDAPVSTAPQPLD